MKKIKSDKLHNQINLLIIAVLLVFICATSSAQTHSGGGIRLGALLPLTGDIAPYGNLIRDGIELAVSDLREQGFQVSIDYEDVPTPGSLAIDAINKLISQKHIQGLAGNFLNTVIPAIAPIIMREKIVAFHTAAADDLVLEAGDMIFSTNSKIREEASKIAEYVYDDIGARSACVLYVGTNFGESYFKHFSREFEARGGTINYSELTTLGERDLRSVLTRVRNSSCEVFFAAYFGNNLGLVLKQAKMLGISKPIMSVYEAEDPSVLDVAGSAAEGLRFFVPEPVVDTPAIENYKSRFAERFGYAARILASNAYDATIILVNSLVDCQGDPECTSRKIYSIHNYQGMSGSLSIDPDGGARKDFVLKIVKNGVFERVFESEEKQFFD